MYRDVPNPAGAITVHSWDDGTDIRYFNGTRQPVEVDGTDADGQDPFVSVDIDGNQHSDSRVERAIRVDGLTTDNLLTLDQARRLGQALIEGVAEAEELNGNDKVLA